VARIYTRTGDEGETGLADGSRVPKDHVLVRVCGDLDETCAAVGAALSTPPADMSAGLLRAVQRDLLAIGALLAARGSPGGGPAPDPRHDLPQERVGALERALDECDRELPPLAAFLVPGGAPKAAALHLARTVCRRAERSAVRLSRAEPVPAVALAYLNRLSDLLFSLARLANLRAGVRDETW